MYGLYTALQDQNAAEVKQAINRFGSHAWSRLKELEKKWKYTHQPAITLKSIRQAISTNKPLKRADFDIPKS
jgi:hypothetical protein